MDPENKNTTSQGEGQTPATPVTPTPAASDKVESSRVKRLSDENAERRNENKELKAQVTTLASELAAIKQSQATAEQERITALREAAAVKFGLPAALASRLSGSTKTEIEKDAEALAKDIPAKPAGTPAATPVRPSPANPANAAGGLTTDDLKKMSVQEIIAQRADVHKVISGKS